MFRYTRVHSDPAGDTHFSDESIPLHDQGDIGMLSDRYPVTSVIFREVKPSYDYDFHNAPQKQFIVVLDVGIEIETSLGDKRQFMPGDVILVEDTTGKGHRTRNLEQRTRRSLFITID